MRIIFKIKNLGLLQQGFLLFFLKMRMGYLIYLLRGFLRHLLRKSFLIIYLMSYLM